MSNLLHDLSSEMYNVYRFRYVTYTYIHTALRAKYRRSYLGFLWTVLTPMIHYVIMGLVFTMLFAGKRSDYFAYYFSGALFFALITGIMNRSIWTFIANEHFIKKIYVPKLNFVLNSVGIELVNFLLSGVSLIILGSITSIFKPSIYSFLSIIPVLLASIALTGVSCLVSICTVYFRDFINIVPAFIQAAFFATPVVYDVSMVPKDFIWVVKYNPLFYYLKAFRQPLLDQTVPNSQTYVFLILLSFSLLFLGLITLLKFNNRIVFKL